MRRSLEATGYRSYILPDCLIELEKNKTSVQNPDYTLIGADRITVIWSQCLEDGNRAVIKMYRHRGRVDWYREKSFRFRVQREFDALTFLDIKGVPCSKPLFWNYGCSPDFGRYEILATREIIGIVPLDVFAQSHEPRITMNVLFPAYRLVGQMHQSGCHHGAMYERNILISQYDPQKKTDAYIIDMPKAILFPYPVTGTRMAWIDLSILTVRVLKYVGADNCAALLMHYGLDAETTRRFIAHIKCYHSTRLKRNLERGECEFWELLAHLGIRYRPAFR
ncbi:MAG: lipopolysaccharide kinase InaA family protein [Kiritimatiellae bacterium]|nr:lipopolysaccharide kinase InaA family protein [Kiritimatiellia bacterium]MDD5520811.1 lipopolysaccharide kinase InaA family protein [Kiritimatiellia bacterium]